MVANPKTYMPTAKAVKTGPLTVEAPGYEKVEGETIPRRNIKTKDALKLRPREDVATIFDVLKYSAATFGNAKAIGRRTILDTHEEVKKVKKMIDGKQQEVDKKWQYFELSGYKYLSFVEFEKQVLTLGAGLAKLGLVHQDRLHIFAATRYVLKNYIYAPKPDISQPAVDRNGTW
jgi:long-chain acyl-CoA synthetase